MNFKNSKARQAEVIRTVQKDLSYTNELKDFLSELLQIAGPKRWIRYNYLCGILAELSYHGFLSIQNLQTLGEEYTGIIQINSDYDKIPSKLVQLISIILEFGGERLYIKFLEKFGSRVSKTEDMLNESKAKIINLITHIKNISPIIKSLHKSIFYLKPDKYQISKRLTGINYVLVKYWLHSEFTMRGYHLLGYISLLHSIISLLLLIIDFKKTDPLNDIGCEDICETSSEVADVTKGPKCILCLGLRKDASLTTCGHVFCWRCILDWLDKRDECPICREKVAKTNVVPLQNYN